ncbi:unnamed protein product [Camellia sinensis]
MTSLFGVVSGGPIGYHQPTPSTYTTMSGILVSRPGNQRAIQAVHPTPRVVMMRAEGQNAVIHPMWLHQSNSLLTQGELERQSSNYLCFSISKFAKLGKSYNKLVLPPCKMSEEYVDEEDLGKLDCGHQFHLNCIKQWLIQKNSCPIYKRVALAN